MSFISILNLLYWLKKKFVIMSNRLRIKLNCYNLTLNTCIKSSPLIKHAQAFKYFLEFILVINSNLVKG